MFFQIPEDLVPCCLEKEDHYGLFTLNDFLSSFNYFLFSSSNKTQEKEVGSQVLTLVLSSSWHLQFWETKLEMIFLLVIY
jgi:hypothetical protein